MFAVVRKGFLAFVLVLVVLTTGAWQSGPVVLAQNQDSDGPAAPLFPDITWSEPEAAAQDLRISVNGDTVSLPGERYEALQQFPVVLPQNIVDFYSNEQLARSGWESYDAFEAEDGEHYVFFHETGVYFSVEFLKCPDAPSSFCIAVWMSEPTGPLKAAPETFSEQGQAAAAATFGKTSPASGSTGIDPTNTKLSWQTYSGADKYKYCVKENSACAEDDSGWTSTYSTSVTVTNLGYNKTYYWQVRATTCETCVPKNWVYANNGVAWTFSTKAAAQVTIVGNAGVGSAVLSYTDGTAKTVTANSTGAYAITVPVNWSGTVTPSKAGYLFTPKSASFTNLTATQTIQNFSAIVAITISGNAGVAGATLSYTDGTPQSVVSDANGNYSIVVPYGWTGTVTPTKLGYSFSPTNRSYPTGLTTNQTAQSFTATFITYTISGNAGTGNVTLTYTNGGQYFVIADGSGNYSITVPMGWSGTVTPNKVQYSFTPANKSYTNVQSNQTQSFSASFCASCADVDTTGVFRPTNGALYLKNMNVTGYADIGINYGIAGDYPVTGDWDGDGENTIGVYRSGVFYLRYTNTVGIADIYFPFGSPGDQPVAGDWDGDGVDTIGVYRSSNFTFYLRNSNTSGVPDITFSLGMPGDVGIVGDWNGDSKDTTGVFRPSNGVIFLKNTNLTGPADVALNYGLPGDKPITGDWNSDGIDTIGVYRGNVFYLRNSNTPGNADLYFVLGNPGDVPIAGNWDGLP